MRKLTKLNLISLSMGLAFSQPLLASDYLSHQVVDNALIVKTDEGNIRIEPLATDAFAVTYQSQLKQLPSFAISEKVKPFKPVVTENGEVIEVKHGDLTAKIAKSPVQISYYNRGELILSEEQGFVKEDDSLGFRFKLEDDEQILGGGQRVLGMDRRGQKMPLYNKAHYGYETQSSQMYYGLSAVMSSNKYALVFDNSAKGNLDIGATQKDVLEFDAVGGRSSYVVVAGDNYPELIDNFTQVTGRQPLPARWTLGNFASRFGYHTQKEVLDTANAYKTQDFPLDALVLDLYWFGKDIKGHMGNLAWDKEAFPEPVKMIQSLKNQGVETVLITEPFVLSTSKRYEEAKDNQALALDANGEPKRFDFYFGNTALVDVFNEKGRSWFNGVYQQLFDQGVAGWWGDLGEPEVHPADTLHNLDGMLATGDEIHNAYGHRWAQMLYNKVAEIDPANRPMIMMRSGFVGSQRYGMVPWTGDVNRSWGGLKPQVELSLQMGMMGLGYTHSDLGGFAGGDKFDQELYVRWLQYGVFQPIYRPHAQENIAPEPVFHDALTQGILREYVKLRYRMLPYNYSLAYENSLTGMPLMRPMMFEDESNKDWFEIDDQYLWGDAFLVKPVTDKGQDSVTMTLPEGHWFNFWNDDIYKGAQSVEVPTNLLTLPVLVRAGSFVPMAKDMPNTKAYDSSSLTVHYYAHADVKNAVYDMYEDDGKNPQAISSNQFQKVSFSAVQNANQLTVKVNVKGDYKGAPKTRILDMQIHNWAVLPKSVSLNGQSTDFSWDEKTNILTFKASVKEALTLTIKG